MERFLTEFSGISFQNLSFRDVWASLTPETQLFISHKVLVTNGRVREFKDLSVINYAYWIIGDRKFLLSRKQTRNIGDLATKWRSSLVNASIDCVTIYFSFFSLASAQPHLISPHHR